MATAAQHEDGGPEDGSETRGGRTPPTDWQDDLTGLPGPAFWRAVLGTESARDRRYGRLATAVLVEIVGLAGLADFWGADVAEQLVAAVARILRQGSRSSDYIARLEGGRLGLILTETDEVAAVNFVERVREGCDKELRGVPETVHVIFGWASPGDGRTLLDAVEEAEQRLLAERGA